MLPSSLVLFLRDDPIHTALGVMTLVYVGALSYFAHNINRSRKLTLTLRFENVQLVEQPRQQKEEAVQANSAKSRFTHDGEAIQIKVVDFDYWDDTEGKWREENWVGNEVIDPGDLRTINTRNLEYVGGESGVVLRVQYKYMTATKGWSEKLNAQSSGFFCKKDGPNPVTVTVLPN